MNSKLFKNWLAQLAKAFNDKNSDAAKILFSQDAQYFLSPFEEPIVGHENIKGYWTKAFDHDALNFQTHLITFHDDAAKGFAQWRLSYVLNGKAKRFEAEGILEASFNTDRRCHNFQEWWHWRIIDT